MRFGVELHGLVVDVEDRRAPESVMDEITDKLMDELLTLSDAIDPEVDSSLAKGEMRLRLYVEAREESVLSSKFCGTWTCRAGKWRPRSTNGSSQPSSERINSISRRYRYREPASAILVDPNHLEGADG